MLTVRFPSTTTLEVSTSDGIQLWQKVVSVPTGVIVHLVPKSPSSFTVLRSTLALRLGSIPLSVLVDITGLNLAAKRSAVCPGFQTLVIDNQAPSGVSCLCVMSCN